MADSTKTPVTSQVGGEIAPGDFEGAVNPTGAVAPRPAWMKPAEANAIPKSVGTGPRSCKPTVPDPNEQGAESELSTSQQIAQWFKSAAATGYGISLILHVLLLIGMALWFFPEIRQAMSITTVVQGDTEELQPFDTLGEVQLEKPAGSEEVVVPQITDVIESADLSTLENKFLQDVTASDTEGDGGSSGIGSGGFRLLEPKNAVKAGSFTAWTIPIAEIPGEKTTAGTSPRPGQDYHIVIQVRVPTNRNSYSAADLSGRVIGTDGYVQVIPAQAYFQDEEGHMVRVRLGRPVPIVEGVVQIVIRVPGAEALVKDTIQIKSKLLRERQTLELVFGKRASSD